MMSMKTVRKWFTGWPRWIGGLLFGALDVGLLVDWLKGGVFPILGAAGPGLYAALAAFFTPLAVVFLWELTPANRERARFRKMSTDLLRVGQMANSPNPNGDLEPAACRLNAQLQQFGLELPVSNLDDFKRRELLVSVAGTLSGHAESGDITAALSFISPTTVTVSRFDP